VDAFRAEISALTVPASMDVGIAMPA